MSAFEYEYGLLNPEQKLAVDTIEGPLLVIAGPGTGKTQLLSARVANIIRQTDIPAQNILCLTFTENGAENMRERLTRFIGQQAYDVRINTYHAFGSEIIHRFPEYFTETRLQNPIDDLRRHQIVSGIVQSMHYGNPLKQTQHHLRDLISTISEVKRSLLTSEQLRQLALQNREFISEGSRVASEVFGSLQKMSSSLKVSLPLFEELRKSLDNIALPGNTGSTIVPLKRLAMRELEAAISEASEIQKTSPLTGWKNTWLAKDASNNFVVSGLLENERILALADVVDAYQAALESRGMYDFDDMILRSIHALETHDELRFTLQEQYLYLLLDEFQDTNAAQLKLVSLLTDNPVNEGRPNVMAVGDDDQAIYAFQGALFSNMVDFYRMYDNVPIINLSENYRSHADVLTTARNIAAQIQDRLNTTFPDLKKELVSANSKLPEHSSITRNEFKSDVAQYAWVAQQINRLQGEGVKLSEIAVLAPKHRQLEPLVPYLNALGVAVRYEKRENVLDAPIIKQLITMCRLILALKNGQTEAANGLWPEVLSYEFWGIATSRIWEMSWEIQDNPAENNWSRCLLQKQDSRLPALLILTLVNRVESDTCEELLDYLIGTLPLQTNEPDMPSVLSPLRDFYVNATVKTRHPETFYETISHLTVLRAKLRDYQLAQESTLQLQDLITFIEMYDEANERMLNTNPYNQQAEAVQVMTAFKSKGLEFEHVFLLCCHDDVWGSSSRGNSNRISLPHNLKHIRYAGASDDERLRILYVALTRAKIGLYLCSYSQQFNGKATKRLKYFAELQGDDGTFKCTVLPESRQSVITADILPPELEHLELDWRARHYDGLSQATLSGLLSERLKRYRFSPTHLNTFVDLEYGGPHKFFFNTLLRFPQAPTVNGQFGNAVHETLEWVQNSLNRTATLPDLEQIEQYFAQQLARKHLSPSQLALETARGRKALQTYISVRKNTFRSGNKTEMNFAREGVVLYDTVQMGGKIDLLEIDEEAKTITVVDYKTGHSYERWKQDTKLHKYRQQLYCYKLLVERSRAFKGFTVTQGRLEFIEPDQAGKIHSLTLEFEAAELQRTQRLILAVWKKIQKLDFPDVSKYEKSLSGIKAFEADLLEESD